MEQQLAEIKAFIEKNEAVRAELTDSMKNQWSRYSLALVDEIIEQQQELKQEARRLNILSVTTQLVSELGLLAIYMRFPAFRSLVSLGDCQQKEWEREGKFYRKYSILIDDMLLYSIEEITNEEHKNAQAI